MFVGQLWRACVDLFQQQVFYDAYFRVFEIIEADTDALRDRVFRRACVRGHRRRSAIPPTLEAGGAHDRHRRAVLGRAETGRPALGGALGSDVHRPDL